MQIVGFPMGRLIYLSLLQNIIAGTHQNMPRMCTYNLCFEQNIRKQFFFSTKNICLQLKSLLCIAQVMFSCYMLLGEQSNHGLHCVILSVPFCPIFSLKKTNKRNKTHFVGQVLANIFNFQCVHMVKLFVVQKMF